MLWTPNTPSSTRHLTKCPLSRLPSLSRLLSSRYPLLCFQRETGNKVLLVCMIHKGWNAGGITQLMLPPTICPSAKEDETHIYPNHLRPCFSPIQSPDFTACGFLFKYPRQPLLLSLYIPIFFFSFLCDLALFFFITSQPPRDISMAQWGKVWGRHVQPSWYLTG